MFRPSPCRGEFVISKQKLRQARAIELVRVNRDKAKALSCAPAALDVFAWLSYRCFVANREERDPLFGDFGLANQLGSIDYARHRRFREKLEAWLKLVRAMWPACPARITDTGTELIVSPAVALHPATNDRYSGV